MRLSQILAILSFLSACSYDKFDTTVPVSSGYPAEIDRIMTTKCATAGCHNTQSKGAAAGLDLSSWDKMFEGTNNGAVTIPFRSDFSTLCYFTNIDSSLGLVVQPTMPIDGPPLSPSEYTALRTGLMLVLRIRKER